MTFFTLLLVAIIAIPIILYFFFPRFLFIQGRNALRRKGKMTQKMVRVGDLNWPYLEGGNPQGAPVVMIHGFGGDKDNWSLYAPYLTGQYRLICPDLPGFGENDRSIDLDHSIAAQTMRLLSFLDALGIEKCHLGGNSMGGYIALQMAMTNPGRLLSLTLLNNAGVLGSQESELQRRVAANESPLVIRTMADIDRLMAFVAFKPRFIPRQFKKVVLEDTAPYAALLDKIFNQIAGDALERPVNDQLGSVSTPTQIIWGRHDRLIDVSCATVLLDGIKTSELVIFEDAGHVPMIEKPAETAKHHLAFLAKH
jgi:abhydrolase domain-containing protein 6